MANIWDDLWAKVRVLTGKTPSSISLEELNEYLEKGEQYTRNAATMAYFAGMNPKSVKELEAAADAIGQVREYTEKARDLALDMKALIQIHQAMKVLNDPSINKRGSEEAARAYGQLFVGIGHFAAKLPPPVNMYAPILAGSGDFFVNMLYALDPSKRQGSRRPAVGHEAQMDLRGRVQ